MRPWPIGQRSCEATKDAHWRCGTESNLLYALHAQSRLAPLPHIWRLDGLVTRCRSDGRAARTRRIDPESRFIIYCASAKRR